MIISLDTVKKGDKSLIGMVGTYDSRFTKYLSWVSIYNTSDGPYESITDLAKSIIQRFVQMA